MLDLAIRSFLSNHVTLHDETFFFYPTLRYVELPNVPLHCTTLRYIDGALDGFRLSRVQ